MQCNLSNRRWDTKFITKVVYEKRLNNTMSIVIDMNHVFSVVVHKEEKFYVAECPEVGTVSQGESIEEAIKERFPAELAKKNIEAIKQAYDETKV